ncbi:MAG: LysM peptidoglycan-binding domain-containing protein, partial [Streptosporangiaceae bacterium]|nr:LysM peptidoglycan-binding domain-containing protein [Streptosporangiaceae bacterium]
MKILRPHPRARVPRTAPSGASGQRARPPWTQVISRLLVAGAVVSGLIAVMQGVAAPHAPSASVPAARLPSAAAHPSSSGVAAQADATPRPHTNSWTGAASQTHARLRTHAAALPESQSYVVRPGDSLSAIARRLGGRFANWEWLYAANRSRISDPDLIYPGQVLTIPDKPPRAFTASAIGGTSQNETAQTGTLGCAALETLWERAGGPASHAALAASIAMAESSGNQYATG